MSEWVTNELNQQMADCRWSKRQIVVGDKVVSLEQCDGEMHER